MSGQVLIIDGLSTRRIHMRAQLARDGFDVLQTDMLDDGLSMAKDTAPEVVIVADTVAGFDPAAFAEMLRARPETRGAALVVTLDTACAQSRVAALRAGAIDVIDPKIPPDMLRSRLRALMRDRQLLEEERALAGSATGLAEHAATFEHPARITLVSCAGAAVGTSFKERLSQCGLPNLSVADVSTVRRAPDPNTDVFVLIEAGQGMVARDFLGFLRSHATARHARVLFVSDDDADPKMAAPLDLGAQDHVAANMPIDETALRITRLALRKRESDRMRKALRHLEHNAFTDRLTGLRNRNYADEHLCALDRDLRAHPRQIAVIIADLDHFKAVNDTHGHLLGDAVLRAVATALTENLRDGDLVARYGGEEFLILLPDLSPQSALSVAKRLAQSVARARVPLAHGDTLAATLSMGLAMASRENAHGTRALLHAADQALYRAKRLGRNRIETAGPDDFSAPPLAPKQGPSLVQAWPLSKRAG